MGIVSDTKMGYERYGSHDAAFKVNKKKIYATQSICGICGKPVDFSLKYPDPLSPCIDHIIPIAKGGHPSDLANLQLAHWQCNRAKSDHFMGTEKDAQARVKEYVIKGNRNLPLSMDWAALGSEDKK